MNNAWYSKRLNRQLVHLSAFEQILVSLTLEAKACSDLPVSTLSTIVPLNGEGPVTFLAQTRHTSTGNSLRLRTTSSWKRPFKHFPFTCKQEKLSSRVQRGQIVYYSPLKVHLHFWGHRWGQWGLQVELSECSGEAELLCRLRRQLCPLVKFRGHC